MYIHTITITLTQPFRYYIVTHEEETRRNEGADWSFITDNFVPHKIQNT